jgi:Predicted membrane protein (DUF2142)
MISRAEAADMFSAVVDQNVVEHAAPAADRKLRRRGWLLAFLAFFLLIGAWAVAAPYDGSPDEQDHILRAASVASGQIVARPASAVRGSGAFVTAPSSLVRDNCWHFKPDRSAACAVEPGGTSTPLRVGSGAGRYHPLYYAVVGWPLALLPNWAGVLIARLLSTAICAALLANALTDAMQWTRHRLMAAGVVVAATPMAASIGGAVNPNGPEIAAGVAFFAAAVPLLLTDSGARSKTLLWHAGVAAVIMAALRAGGPLWVAVALGALLVAVRWTRLRELWNQRAVRWWMLGIGVAAVQSVLWTMLMKTTYMGDFTGGQHWSISQATRQTLEYWRNYADEMVGVTAWLDTRMPAPAYLVWEFGVAALVVWGFVLADRAGRWRLAVLAAGGLGIPFAMQVLFVNRYGFITQGRYLLPVAVGLPMLGAFLIQRYGLAADKSRSLLGVYALGVLPIHLVCLVYTMIRWQHGIRLTGPLRSMNPFTGTWQPPLGTVLPLAAMAAGLLLLGWLTWRGGRPGAQPAAAQQQVDAAPAAVGELVVSPASLGYRG